jgi:dTDP-4-dehydrorhamnose reductase
MKILLTGVNGQVGWELQRSLATLGTVIAPRRDQLDLSDAHALRESIRSIRPQLIVNPAAYTAVDKAESEPALAYAINAIAPAIMAEEAKTLGAAIVHFSTDYVFDGSQTQPWQETDTPNPLGVYGATKLEGEQAIQAMDIPHLILRTSWVYGLRGGNFLLTMQRLFREREQLNIVNDQFGAPTWSRMIAEASAQILAQRPFAQPHLSGIYHLSNGGRTHWHEFASAILARTPLPTGKHITLTPIPATHYPTPAQRPANSVLNNGKLYKTFHIQLPDWEAALNLCLSCNP